MSTTFTEKRGHRSLLPAFEARWRETDPEWLEILEQFTGEVVQEIEVPEQERWMAILAILAGGGARDVFEDSVPSALDAGVTPIQVKEMLIQATAYVGLGQAKPLLDAVNRVFLARGIALPLESQRGAVQEERLVQGIDAQVAIFGDGMKTFTQSGPEDSRHINVWLARNCFGDYYTRSGLDLRERELMTFCYLTGLNGCPSQLTSHALGNLKMGNTVDTLIRILSHAVPFIGYPRVLNALNCVREAEKFLQGPAK